MIGDDDIDSGVLFDFMKQYETDPYGALSGWGGDTLSAMGVANDTDPGNFDRFIGAIRSIPGIGRFGADLLKNYGPSIGNALTSRTGLAGIAALLSVLDRQRRTGGGTPMAYAGPKPVTRTLTPSATPGAPGPVTRFAAQGGLMQAYAQGGHVKMEDGGFVLTKRAVDGAGGPQGLASLVPHARMIRGPGTGTSDSIPASIQGRSGVTPAKVSNGEAYVPRRAVQQAGGPEAMYALMHKLQRRA
jgi:hypothetical protein